MLLWIAILLVVLWLFGHLLFHIAGMLIHFLVIVALILLIVHLVKKL